MKKRIRILAVIFSGLAVTAVVMGLLIYNGILWMVYPEMMGYHVKGIDVARYQGEIDWEVIASQEISFAFIKATEGSSYSDPMFMDNMVSSVDNGIATGAYHFFSSESAGITQAENFIRVVSDYSMQLPPVLDFEINGGDRESVIAEALIFLQEVEEYFGVRPIIYTTYESYRGYLTEGFEDYPLWFRDLLKEPQIEGGREWLFWQYCNRGRLKGIDKKQKYVDLNVFYGTGDEFELYLNSFQWKEHFNHNNIPINPDDMLSRYHLILRWCGYHNKLYPAPV